MSQQEFSSSMRAKSPEFSLNGGLAKSTGQDQNLVTIVVLPTPSDAVPSGKVHIGGVGGNGYGIQPK